MDRQEFAHRLLVLRGRVSQRGWRLMAVFFGGLGLGALLLTYGGGAASVGAILATLAIVAALVGIFALAPAMKRREQRRLGLCCPHCGRPLLKVRQVVLEKGVCGYCGQRVLN